jgi:hypothetical protein
MRNQYLLQFFSVHGESRLSFLEEKKLIILAVGSRDFEKCERTFVVVLVPLVYYWWNKKPMLLKSRYSTGLVEISHEHLNLPIYHSIEMYRF